LAIKVFISHQKSDTALSRKLADRLRLRHQIESYLDDIDPYIGGPVERLADHIRREMGSCTQLLAVVSPTTPLSQWVPWEIGVATEKDFPLATYSPHDAIPPEFLRKWPYLRSEVDLDHYAVVSKQTASTLMQKRQTLSEAAALRSSIQGFYSSLRAVLGQSNL
jgi:hypothetical protein